MSVKTVITPPFCENGCVYLCDICAHNIAAAAAKAANDAEADEALDMLTQYPSSTTTQVISAFKEVPPKIIKIKQVIVVKPLEPLPLLQMEEGKIVQYPNE